MPTVPNHYVVPLLFGGLIVWRLYARLRRNIGRQPLQPKRMVARIAIFAVVTCGLAVFSFTNQRLLAGLGGGVVLGLPLAWLGLKLTKFETTAEGQFYTPHSMIGAGLTILVVLRVAYRFMVLSNSSNIPGPQSRVMQSPLSLLFFGLLAGYYIVYYTGVLMRCRAASS
jgi:cytochrome b561